MIYKIVVDKQPMTNPSGEKKEYTIDIDELHFKRDVYDSLVITHDEDYVMRRLELGEYNVLTELNPPIKEPLPDLNIELFEGDNYIYLYDMTGNRIVAQYLVKNEFNELYVLENEMTSAINQSAKAIELNVNQKLTGYSTTEEMNSAITLKADEITSTVSSTYETKSNAQSKYSQLQQTDSNISSTVATKVGNNEIISKINQSSEKVTIDANKINLKRKDNKFNK